MGLLEALKDHEPIDLSKKKILIGEAVIQIDKVGVVHSAKTEKDYLTFKAVVINVPAGQKEGVNIVAGNRFELMMELEQDKKIQKLINNLFTAGYNVDKSSEESILNDLIALENKLVYAYFGKGKFKPEDKDEEIEFQTYRFLNAKKLTPENSAPQVPF
jgi:hypothetical protein